jgi:uncharacterized protein with GYD domain
MGKYLIQASYSPAGAKAVIKEGGTARRAAVEKAVKSLRGKVEAFYYGFGDNDVYVLIDAPDNVAAAALALAVGTSGAISSYKTTVLLAPEEIDLATKKKVAYRAPGARSRA